MKGPTIMGRATANTIRTPWKWPALSLGVKSRMRADRAAVTSMYPDIMTLPATMTPAMDRTRKRPRSPAIMTPAAGRTKFSLPYLSRYFPASTLTSDANRSTTPSTMA